METINEVIDKKGSIEHLWKIIDPDNRFSYKTAINEWYRLSLTEQRRMYLYLLYKKWVGDKFYNSPYEIITNCHPYPTNWNGRPFINRLMKDGTYLVRAVHNGEKGTFTLDEARVWQMKDIKPLNFRIEQLPRKEKELIEYIKNNLKTD